MCFGLHDICDVLQQLVTFIAQSYSTVSYGVHYCDSFKVVTSDAAGESRFIRKF